MLVRLIGEDITLTTRFDTAAGRVKIDPTQFDQIIINLITNASEAINGPGTIVVETARTIVEPSEDLPPSLRPGEYVRVSVTDTGVGMDAQTQEQIFAPFFTTKARGRGTGLGLPVVHGITEQAGGHINVESTAGAGAAFHVYLPSIRPSEIDEARAEPSANREQLTGTETVLVVEDEPPLLSLAQRTLESYGYRVLSASSPPDALAIAKTEGAGIALLLTDVVMPVMSGKQLADRIAAMHPGIKIVFMSGYPANVLEGRGAEPSPASYIQKPFSRHMLARHIRAALDGTEPPP
jgi:two-component system, cell cycle sensor histidine kinase and response regulator CckA